MKSNNTSNNSYLLHHLSQKLQVKRPETASPDHTPGSTGFYTERPRLTSASSSQFGGPRPQSARVSRDPITEGEAPATVALRKHNTDYFAVNEERAKKSQEFVPSVKQAPPPSDKAAGCRSENLWDRRTALTVKKVPPPESREYQWAPSKRPTSANRTRNPITQSEEVFERPQSRGRARVGSSNNWSASSDNFLALASARLLDSAVQPTQNSDDIFKAIPKRKGIGLSTQSRVFDHMTSRSSQPEPSETMRSSVRVKTPCRPHGHDDVIKYQYSGGICPSGPYALESELSRMSQTAAIYSQISQQVAEQQRAYTQNRARSSSSSAALREHLYDRRT